jgi:type IV pilus assembly protein PilC
MLFSRELPLASLIELCRVLHHNLDAGLTLRDVFRQQAARGNKFVRPVAQRIGAALEKGDSLESTLKREKEVFPALFISLATVGEQTGSLPEIFGELEKYYLMRQKLRRQFRSQSMLPLIQFFLALFIIAFVIFVLGMVAAARNTQPADVTGLGLRGTRGAILFLAGSFILIAAVYAGYLFVTRKLQQKAAVDALLLRLPLLGPYLEALAVGRFALALRLTLETGMSVTKALRLSFQATGNAAFVARTEMVTTALRGGEELSVALAQSRLFPADFLNLVAVAEEGGRVPEMMQHQAKYYQEEASRRLTALTRGATFGVWMLYALFMIFAIFRFAHIYLGALGG